MPGPSNYRPLPSVGVDPVVVPVRPVVLHDHDMVLDDKENIAPPNPLSDVSYPLITAYCSRAQARDEDLVQLGEESDLGLGPVPLTTVWATCTLVNARAHICLPLMAADAPPPHALIRARHDVTRLTSPVLGRMPLSRNVRSYSLKTVCIGHHSADAGRAATCVTQTPTRHTASRRTHAARNRALPEPLRLQSPSGEAGVTFQPGHLQPRRRGDQPQLSEFNGA